jgi:hypothetical protein
MTKMRVLRALPLALLATMAGCATAPPPPMHWVKAGATEEMFLKERYACLQQAQQPQTGSYVNGYGGSSYGTMITNQKLFFSCMEAAGYKWELVTPVPVAAAAKP